MRWLLILKIFASCRPSSHIDLPLFSRYFTCVDMVIFLVAMLTFSAARAQFSLIAARFRHAMFFWGLVLATEVGFIVIVVMRVVAALFVVVVVIAAARLVIFGLIAALLVGVLSLFVWGWYPWRCQPTCLRCSSASVVHVLFFLLLAALFLQVLLLTSTLSSREI
jgi:hypothetical protein